MSALDGSFGGSEIESGLEKVESTLRGSTGSGVHQLKQKSDLIGQESGSPFVGCLLVEKNTCTWLLSDVLAGNQKKS